MGVNNEKRIKGFTLTSFNKVSSKKRKKCQLSGLRTVIFLEAEKEQ